MANILLQTTAYGLNIIGGIIMVLAVLLPYWKENDVEVCIIHIKLILNKHILF